jgi:hypothetical protein
VATGRLELAIEQADLAGLERATQLALRLAGALSADEDVLAQAQDAGVLDASEAAVLADYQALVREIIAVDAFPADSFARSDPA